MDWQVIYPLSTQHHTSWHFICLFKPLSELGLANKTPILMPVSYGLRDMQGSVQCRNILLGRLSTMQVCCTVQCCSTPALDKFINPKKRLAKLILRFFICQLDKHFLMFYANSVENPQSKQLFGVWHFHKF